MTDRTEKRTEVRGRAANPHMEPRAGRPTDEALSCGLVRWARRTHADGRGESGNGRRDGRRDGRARERAAFGSVVVYGEEGLFCSE